MLSRAKRCFLSTDNGTAAVDPQAIVPVETHPPTVGEASEDANEGGRRKRRRVSRRSSDLVSAIPSVVFRRLAREIASDFKSDLRWEGDALEALQVDAEAYLIGRFSEANRRKELCKSGTLKKAHFAF